jgi:putative glutamine amidotransferase
MRSPLIGITTYGRNANAEFTLPAAYVEAVTLAGGCAVLLPPSRAVPLALLEGLDGLIFAGGGDIAPERYGGQPHPTVYLVDPERDAFELALAAAALERSQPVLGICRGLQVLAVATGATLVPHVPAVYGDRVQHRLDHPRRPIEHQITVAPNCQLASILGTTATVVTSWHHQAIARLPDCWRPVAAAADGLIEAVEHRHHPWMVAVQWHPELSGPDPVQQRLFQALVQAAQPTAALPLSS